ncbi:DNA double-strand break repair nuclease NurA [Bacillus sp. FJAT-45037]|uniref:DNA double-strand break repair nuclease NurA n=1 Tax=Bacillus sp. FJAT-45037 TaxID=2011007 RepID=UPI000C247693|nr:DNA double-strand break repair nuclease NurA [Bacillus sp. FJAT-45037]
MLNLSPELARKLEDIGNELKKFYSFSTKDKEGIRQKLRNSEATFRQMQLYSTKKLSNWLNGREVAAVDGSVNQTKGQPPHLLYLFQALAKTTTGYECRASDVYAPLLHEKEEGEMQQTKNWRSHLLAKLELEVAIQLIKERNLGLLMMDGALYHYRIDAPEEWETLRQLAVDREVLLVGVSEEITTENLIKLPDFSSDRRQPQAYDRDVLFGVLERAETLYVPSIQQKAGLESTWMRPSTSPAITGFDLLVEQGDQREHVANLLYTLTPKEGRGIPLWLDYVDRDVRVTDKLVEALVEQYIDPEIKQRLFVQKRQDRPY